MKVKKHTMCPYCKKKIAFWRKYLFFGHHFYPHSCPFCGKKINYKKWSNLQGVAVLVAVILSMLILKDFPLLRRWLIVPYTIALLIGIYYAEWIGVDDEN